MVPVIYAVFSCLLLLVTSMKVCLTQRTSRSFPTAIFVSMLLFLPIEANIWVTQAICSWSNLFIFRRHINSVGYMREHARFVSTRPCTSLSLALHPTQVLLVNCVGLLVGAGGRGGLSKLLSPSSPESASQLLILSVGYVSSLASLNSQSSRLME